MAARKKKKRSAAVKKKIVAAKDRANSVVTEVRTRIATGLSAAASPHAALAREGVRIPQRNAAKKKSAKRKNAETARETFKRTHWGEEGKRKRPRELNVPNPTASALVELGRLRRVEYETDKGDGVEIFFHDFGREVKGGAEHGRPSGERCPVLAFNREGLVIAGGNYRVQTEGIVG